MKRGYTVKAYAHERLKWVGIEVVDCVFVHFTPDNRKLNQAACGLLNDRTLSIKAIAEKLRFSDEYYFTRFFTKMNGVPPAAYRKRSL